MTEVLKKAKQSAVDATKATVAKAATSVAIKLGSYLGIALVILLLVWGIFYVLVGTFTAILGTVKEIRESREEAYTGGYIEGLPYANLINQAAEKFNIDPALIAAVIRQESGFDPEVTSSAGAQGLMQLMPSTAKTLGVKDPTDPKQNIMGGTRYLWQQLLTYDGSIPKALAAYNAGPANVADWLVQGPFENGHHWDGTLENVDQIPFQETRNYVKNVMKYQKEFSKYVKGGKIDFASGSFKGSPASKYPYKNASTSGVDAWGFFNRQCTSFVAWRLNDAGIRFKNRMKGGHFGNAENWDNNAKRLGYKVNNKPAVGAVAQWDQGTYGHVAFVTDVKGSKVTIEEYNREPYEFTRRTIPASQVEDYIHFR